MGYIEGQDRNQIIMFPESIDEYISDDSAVRVIDTYVDQLDMEKLGFQRATAPVVGRPPYSPKDLLKLYLYGYLNRVRSSRRLEHEAVRNIEVIWLLKKLKPDFKTIADFRKDNKKALKAVFRDFTKLCDEWDLFGKELVAVDGSKFRASNSKRNNYNAKKIERHIKYIDEKIENYMRIGYEYRNYEACKNCEFKERCTKSKKGRAIFRHVDQDFLDTIDLQTQLNMEKYKLRQMIVEHPFGTIKRSWGAYYFLTRRKVSVTAEISLSYLAYNMKRVMNILGIDEMLRRLKERRKPVLI